MNLTYVTEVEVEPENLTHNSREDLISFISTLDLYVADWGFTKELILTLLKSCDGDVETHRLEKAIEAVETIDDD